MSFLGVCDEKVRRNSEQMEDSFIPTLKFSGASCRKNRGYVGVDNH